MTKIEQLKAAIAAYEKAARLMSRLETAQNPTSRREVKINGVLVPAALAEDLIRYARDWQETEVEDCKFDLNKYGIDADAEGV